MAYSKLCDKIIESPNHSGKRTEKLAIITPHIIVGMASMETLGNIFIRPARQASSNYGVCVDGIVGIVDEDNRSWCSSSNWNDQKAITIEVASENYHPYKVPQYCFDDLVDLCVDICKRHGFKRMVNTSSKEDLEAKLKSKAADTVLLSKHNYYANKSCPGPDLGSRFDELCEKVNSALAPAAQPQAPVISESKYTVQLGAYTSLENANKHAGIVAGSYVANVDGLYKVFTGSGTKAEMTTLKNTSHKGGFVTKLPDNINKVTPEKEPVKELKVGDIVTLVKNAPVYNTNRQFQSWVYNKKLYVRSINGNRIVVSTLKEGAVTGAVDRKYIIQ